MSKKQKNQVSPPSIEEIVWVLENTDSPKFKGPEAFCIIRDQNLIRKRRPALMIGTLIRVYNYSVIATSEKIYVVTRSGLQLVGLERETTSTDPTDALSCENAPDGWSIEGFNPSSLSDPEDLKISISYK